MPMTPSVLVIIPARGGSKGILRKNLQVLLGKTLLQRTCGLALSIRGATDVLCSSEDKEILELAKNYGVNMTYIRPQHLALDETPTADVIIHALSELAKSGKTYGYVILLEVTSQLTRSVDVEEGLNCLLNNENFDSIITLAKSENGHPIFTFSIDLESLQVKPYLEGPWRTVRRQDINPLYFIDGSFYISKVSTFLKYKSFVQDRTLGFIVPKWQSFEIDEPLDLIIAEAVMKRKIEDGEFLDG